MLAAAPSFTRFDGSKPSKIRDIIWLRYKYTPMISHDSITYHNTSVRYHCYLWTYTPKNRGWCITFSHVYGLMMKNEAIEPPTQCLPSSMLWSRLFSKHVSWFASINGAIQHITTHIINVINYNPYSTILSPYWKPYHDHIIYQSIYHIIYLYHIMYDTMDHSNVL